MKTITVNNPDGSSSQRIFLNGREVSTHQSDENGSSIVGPNNEVTIFVRTNNDEANEAGNDTTPCDKGGDIGGGCDMPEQANGSEQLTKINQVTNPNPTTSASDLFIAGGGQRAKGYDKDGEKCKVANCGDEYGFQHRGMSALMAAKWAFTISSQPGVNGDNQIGKQ